MSETIEVEDVDDPDDEKRRRIRLTTVDDVRAEMARIYRGMRTKRIPMQDGTRLIYVLQQLASVTQMSVTEAKVNAINEALQRRGLIPNSASAQVSG